MHVKFAAGLAAALIAGTLVSAPPVSADKGYEPTSSGVVDRFDTVGWHQVGPIATDVGGYTLPVVVVVGWDDALALCTGAPPVFNGVQQDVVTPSGNITTIVHNEDIPALVFDVSTATSELDFLLKCAAREIVPLAAGAVKQRPIIHTDADGFSIKIVSKGDVTDAAGNGWRLQAFSKTTAVFGQSVDIDERVALTPL